METKNSKGIIVLIMVLVLLVLSLGGYLVYGKVLAPSGDNITTITTTTTTTTTKPDENKSSYIHEETFDYSLNGTNHKITYKYYYETNSEDTELGYILAEVYMNNKKIDGADTKIFYFEEPVKNNNEAKEALLKGTQYDDVWYPKLLNKDNLLTMKGADKDYLVLSVYQSLGFYPGSINPQIVNDSGKLLYTAKIMEGSTLYYKDVTKSKPYTNSDASHNQFYINNDKLYYITFNCFSPTDDGNAYEYTLTVANDKVSRTEALIPSGQYDGAGAKC